jgi:hypothetical protein
MRSHTVRSHTFIHPIIRVTCDLPRTQATPCYAATLADR